MAKAMMEQIDVTHLYVGKEDSYVYKFQALNKEGKPIQSMEITDIKLTRRSMTVSLSTVRRPAPQSWTVLSNCRN